MDINRYIKKISGIELVKKYRLAVMALYGIIMLISIWSKMNLITFILLFAVTPIGIYFYVKRVFPRRD